MADTDLIETTAADRHDQFVNEMAAKYGADDEVTVDAEDGIAHDEGTSDTDDADTAAHTATGTSDAADGQGSESGEEAVEDEEAEHPDDDPEGDTPADPSSESAEGAESTEGGDAEGPKDGEDEIAEATKTLLASKGADLKLEDVPQEFRPIIEKKLRGIEQAFSRAQQELTSYRGERAQFEAERRFQEQHPELLIAELLRKHPELEAKVFEASPDPDDAASLSAFDQKVADQRKAAKEAVDAATAAFEQAMSRADTVVNTGKTLAQRAGIPFDVIEPHIVIALNEKPDDGSRDLTEQEIGTIVARVAKSLNRPIREQVRQRSKEAVQQRTAARKVPVPPRTNAAPSRIATPVPERKKPVNWSDEESRQARMMESARRLVPGRK